MANLEEQTAVERVADGKYRADVSTDWKMWVPVGGYLSAIALRAAQAQSTMPRPASITVHYLHEAKFGPVDITVTTLRTAPRSESMLVHLSQDGVDVLVALVSGAPTGVHSPQVNWLPPPDVPGANNLPEIVLDEDVIAMMGDEPFWKKLEIRPVRLGHTVDVPEGLSEEELRFTPKRHARIRAWDRLADGATYNDPWVDACRYLVITDASQFPTVATPFTPPLPFVAPTVSLTVEFHSFHPAEPWLLIEGTGSYAGDGLIGTESRLWSPDGDLVATGYSQMTVLDLSVPTPASEQQAWFDVVDA